MFWWLAGCPANPKANIVNTDPVDTCETYQGLVRLILILKKIVEILTSLW